MPLVDRTQAWDFLCNPFGRIYRIYQRYRTIAPIKPRLKLTDDPDYYVELRLTRLGALRVIGRLLILVLWTCLQEFLLYFGIVLQHCSFRTFMASYFLSIRVRRQEHKLVDIAKDPAWYPPGAAESIRATLQASQK